MTNISNWTAADALFFESEFAEDFDVDDTDFNPTTDYYHYLSPTGESFIRVTLDGKVREIIGDNLSE